MAAFSQISLVRQAYLHGIASRENARMRVSPFYNERVLIGGKRIDITAMLDTFWLAGYDGETYPEQPKDEVTAQEALDALDATPNPVPAQHGLAPEA
jgi:hypothetical protein